MSPSASSDAVDKSLMEKMDILLFCRNPLFHGHLSKGIHEDPDVDLIRTTGPASLTVNAKPDGTTPQNFFFHPHLDHPDDIVVTDIHVRGSRTSRRALQTLITEIQFLSALLRGFFQKR